MKVNVQSQNRKINDAFETMTPINNILKCFGLNCIYRVNNDIKSHWSLLKNLLIILICVTLNSVAIYYKLKVYSAEDHEHTLSFTDTLQWIFLLGFAQYVFGLTIVYKYGTKITVEYYNSYNNIDKIIGMMCYRHVKNCIIRMIAFFFIVTITSSVCDFAAWYLCYSWTRTMVYSVEYVYSFIKMLILLELVCHVIQIEYRIHMLGNFLKDLYSKTLYIPGLYYKDIVVSKDWINKGNDDIFVDWIKNYSGSKFGDLSWLSRCYLLLIEQTTYINTTFGIKMILLCLSYLMDMIDVLNLAIRVVTKSMILTAPYPAITSFMRLGAFGTLSLGVIYHCEKCYWENERIVRNIDYLMVNKKISKNLRATLKDFRKLVITRPVNFHGYNFFKMDYPLLVSVASVVVTYTIILLQTVK